MRRALLAYHLRVADASCQHSNLHQMILSFQRVNASGKKWVIVTDLDGEPAFVLDSHHFLRDALFD
jgi:hypothetical protein